MSFLSLHHLVALLHSYGAPVLGTIVALESFGLPVPGESLLITAAIVAATTQQLNIITVVAAAAIGAVLGQMGGYWIGRSVGFRLLRRYGSYIGLTSRRLALGRALFRRHGVKLVVVSRFVVLLRTVAALLAGANRMPWGRFMLANVLGSVAWSTLYGVGAYFLGHEAKHLAGPTALGIGAVIVLALVAAALYARRHEQLLLSRPVRAQRSVQ